MSTALDKFQNLASSLIPARALATAGTLSLSLLPHGLARGTVVEIASADGGGKTEIVIELLAQNPEMRAAWIERKFTLYPSSILEREIPSARILCVETSERDPLWAAHQVLRSQLFELIVLADPVAGENELRRLQIAAKKSASTVILLASTTTKQGHWPISTQLAAHRAAGAGDGISISILKDRGSHL